MLSHPPYSQQQPQQQQSQDDFGYLSSSLPLPEHQRSHHQHQQLPSAGLLTSSYDPHLFDDICFLDPADSSSSSLPLNEHEDWFPFSGHDDMNGMNMDPSFYHQSMPTIDEVAMPATSMPPPPPLSQSFSPQSDMSMTSPQAQQHQSHQTQQPNQTVNTTNNNHLMTPAYKGHRRRRSSSLPSIFYSAKKQIVQSPFVPPLFDNSVNQDNTYSPIQQNIPDYQQQQHQQQPMMEPLDSSSVSTKATTGPQPSIVQQQQYTKPLPIQIQRNPVANPRQISPITLDQQQLDKKLLKVNFNDVTVAELKDFLRERNLSVAGRKAELADRLYQERQRVQQKHQHQDTEAAPPPPPSNRVTSHHPHSTSAATSPSPSSPSVVSQSQPPHPHIQQLTHRLSDLGFQHPPPPSLAFPIYNQQQQQQQSTNNTIPVPLPDQQQPTSSNQQQQQPFLDYPTQQQLDENNSMSQYYKF